MRRHRDERRCRLVGLACGAAALLRRSFVKHALVYQDVRCDETTGKRATSRPATRREMVPDMGSHRAKNLVTEHPQNLMHRMDKVLPDGMAFRSKFNF
jgi:hypothetical protein